MNWDRLNQWLTLGANVGVLIGIVLLIVEIDQNSDLTLVQIEQTRSDAWVAWQRQIASGDHVAPLLAKFMTTSGPLEDVLAQLTPEEMVRIDNIVTARYFDYENMYSQYQRGLVSDAYYQERLKPIIRRWAPYWKLTNPPDGPPGRQAFKDEVERILSETE